MTTPWEIAPPHPGSEALARELRVSPTLAALLAGRGFAEPAAARRFLGPRLSDLTPPDTMAGLRAAVDLLAAALRDGRRVGVFGDYDVDGVSSATLIGSFLRDCGADVVIRVGRREAGYGLTEADAAAMVERGCDLVVACDCGTSDAAAVGLLRGRGLDVIVVDHHQVPATPLPASALVNPQQPGCRFPFKGLASVGLAFYLCATLRTALRAAGHRFPARTVAPGLAAASGAPAADDGPDPRDGLDLVAVGTIADLAPLVDDNRILVRHGLRMLARSSHPGLKALAEISGSNGESFRAEDVAFRIAPRLNAPGRLGDADAALGVLLETDPRRARALASECDAANRTRQRLQEAVYAEALAAVEARGPGAPLVFAAGQGWHPGVVGIVAAKLVERYGLPATVIALEGRVGRGSARTVPGFHLYEALRQCAAHLVRFGGHAAAAGMTVETTRLDAFREALEGAARAAFPAGPPAAAVHVEARLPLHALTRDLCREVATLEPFGHGNPEPVICCLGLRVTEQRLVGERQDHLALTLAGDGAEARAIGFRMADRAPGVGATVDVAFTPEPDDWRGQGAVQLRIKDLRPADAAGSPGERP
ncbi:MAG: single-stranded-DNA-specific exonuclease RecJ [Deltaproteobacteria bacterium]|nr:single-stranded-DNA-specific exonuclease RecJ [Deltaproteobacteria bacterium]